MHPVKDRDMNRMFFPILFATVSCAALLPAAEIRNAGILANSGEAGDALVLTGLGKAGGAVAGAGVAVDAARAIWCRGAGTLLKLAPDGRMLAQYPVPKPGSGNPRDDVLALAGAHVVLKQGDALCALPVDAPSGTAAVPLDAKAHALSFSATRDGWLAAVQGQEIFMLDPATGTTEPIAVAPKRPNGIEVDEDGVVYVRWDHRIHRYENGAETLDGWPRGAPGDRLQLLDGYWWSHAWHGTIRRHDLEGMRPAPGVVLGGNSGSFIGHLDENPDVNNGRGMAKLRDGVYVECGGAGVVSTLDWDAAADFLVIRRRLGPLAVCNGLAIDRYGRIFTGSGNWEWTDGPDAPVRHGVPPEQNAPGVVVGDTSVLIPCWIYGTRPSVFTGDLASEVRGTTLGGPLAYGRDIAALAVWREARQNWMVIAQRDGTARATRLGGNFLPAGDPIQMELVFREPVTTLASLVARPSGSDAGTDSLLAAADGSVIELARTETGFAETARWNRWGPDDDSRFGGEIRLYAHSDRLWVADSARARVLVFELGSTPEAPLRLAQFGRTDHAGRGMDALDTPTHIAAFGDRAALYDAGNQRIVKLEFVR
ncbi:MAG: hypothetical protein ACOX5G_10540 [Kiritimatiellia bacterium]